MMVENARYVVMLRLVFIMACGLVKVAKPFLREVCKVNSLLLV